MLFRLLARRFQPHAESDLTFMARGHGAVVDQLSNAYDITAKVNTTDPRTVSDEINSIYLALFPQASTQTLDQAFLDMARLYRGEYPGYQRCDTAYHNVQHVMDVTLAMARL